MRAVLKLRTATGSFRATCSAKKGHLVKDQQHITKLPRRYFLERSGLALLGSAALASRSSIAAAGNQPNPFGYDVTRFSQTDPKLVGYESIGRFTCPMPEPNRLSIGLQDELLIAGRDGVSIHKTFGESVVEIPLTEPARCAIQGRGGLIYVGVRDHVKVFASDGKPVRQWEALSGKPWLTGLAESEDSLFLADSGNRTVWHYDKAGKVLEQIGRRDKERDVPGLVLPSPYLDVKLGTDGLLRVNNPGRHVVEVYTQKGELELSWGKPGAGIQTFCGCCNPIGLSLLSDGSCVTCEKGLPRVKVYSAKGDFECVVAGPEAFPGNAEKGALLNKANGRFGGMDAAVDASGRICVLDLVSGDVNILRRKA